MKSIDIHAHIVPEGLWKAIEAKKEWHGFRHEPGEGLGSMVGGGMRTGFTSPKVRYTVEERLKDMDALKVDVQVLSIHTPFVGYHLEATQGLALAREFNVRVNIKKANIAGMRLLVNSSTVPASAVPAISHCPAIILMPSSMKAIPRPSTIPITMKRGNSLAIQVAAPVNPNRSQMSPVASPAA